ncbi:Spermidine hydroxycinnamoyl transferase [Spatholobus suberectus]|nr:Spermidine hydroxycinnamoyl transferase [Spatholobus suberectus]
MSTVTTSYTVTPNEPTPNVSLWLSESDQVARWSHTSTIFIYKENQSQNALERMRDSLSKILVHYYPLAGRLSWIEGGRLALNCNAKGVTLIEAQSPKTMAEYGDFAPNETLKKELIPPVDYSQPIEELPLLLVQLTKFQGINQGLAIGVAFSHVLCDGLAAIRFINTWAKLTRGETLDSNEMVPFLDRTVINSTYPPRPPCFDHPELKPLPLKLGSTDTKEEQKKEKTAVILRLTSQEVEKLKKKTNDDPSLKKERLRPYSRYEVIAAHIWRCASKARELDGLQPTVVRVSADIRNRLNPPLPRNYFGNALAVALTPTCHAGELISNPLSYVARNIREAIELFNDEYIRSQLDFIRCQEQLDWIRASYLDQVEPKNAPFYGNPNLTIVSWMSMPIYEADFGWGKPVYFGPGAVYPDGKAYIIRSSNEDGSLIVSVHLQTAHVELFKKFFYEDI